MKTATVRSSEVVTSLDLPFPKHSGKVREVFNLPGGELLLIVATDRISTFDVVHPNGIPGKGICLTKLTRFWLTQVLADAIPGLRTHLVGTDFSELRAPVRNKLDPYQEQLAGRMMIVRRLKMVPLECVVRARLFGSVESEYAATQTACGVPLPAGLRRAEALPRPIFTPATKARVGHDENISVRDAIARGLVTRDLVQELERLSLAVFAAGATHAASRAIILADTKLELGLDRDSNVVLADEVLTPDSSRFWPADGWPSSTSPTSMDKQFVRDYVSSIGWDKQPPAPELPADVVTETVRRYDAITQRLTATS